VLSQKGSDLIRNVDDFALVVRFDFESMHRGNFTRTLTAGC
jgi:hypothetical protein